MNRKTITNKIVFTLIASISLLIPGFSNASETPVLEEVLVKSEPELFLSGNADNIKVITSEDISRSNASSLNEVLQMFSSVNLTERGVPGSQTDIEINGSSGESVIILLNGIKVRDPQTAHFTMDTPVDISDIDRIELLSGGGASLYGSSTSGGIINIVTKNNFKGFGTDISGGSYGSAGIGISFSGKSFRVNVKSNRSDGYRRNSDFQSNYAGLSGSFTLSSWNFHWNTGIEIKKFGAEDFYSNHPSYEKTSTLLGGLNVSRAYNKSFLSIKSSARGHADDFILIRNNPDYYRNAHYNRSYLISSEYLLNLNKYSSILIGAESEKTGITSGKLGNHSSDNTGVYSRFSFNGGIISSALSLRFDSGYRNENNVSPSLGFSIPLNTKTKISLSAEKSFRSPNYTELYYKSPGNIGNPNLKSEQAKLYNISCLYDTGTLKSKLSLFSRNALNVIDWVRFEGENDWNAENQGKITTNGIDGDIKYLINSNWQTGLNAVILKQSIIKPKGIESKYSLRPLGKTFSFSVNGRIFSNIESSIFLRYEEQIKSDTRMPVSISFSRNFKNLKALLNIKNLFNEHYEEIPGLPVPGRWIEFKVSYSG